MEILNTKKIKNSKLTKNKKPLHMLTCYDFQTAQLLNETSLDLILVGDSLGNVILGFETTVEVTLQHMMIFSRAVKHGAPNKFVVVDLPFGSYRTINAGLNNAVQLFQYSKAEALKLEGAFPYQLKLIERLTQVGIPVMGHIGLTPQSVHEQGGYYIHGKDQDSKQYLLQSAKNLEKAGAFAIVLECIEEKTATLITKEISIPTIGIGSGPNTDGQVLVINDLLKMGKNSPPKFCTPITDSYSEKKQLIENYLTNNPQIPSNSK